MSFRNEADKVRNGSLSIGLRYRCLLSCIERYCSVTETGFRQICSDLHNSVGFQFGAQNDEDTLTLALKELSDARETFLLVLDRFAAARTQAKARGRRQPSKREIETLYASVTLGAPSFLPRAGRK